MSTRCFANNLTKPHARVFAGLLAVFSTLTFLITDGGLNQGPGHDALVLKTSLFTVTGPLTGAISRGFQGCCLQFSLSVMVYSAPVLLVGILMQFVRLPDSKLVRAMRMVFWTLGWLVWFLGGILSFGHALG